MRFGLRATPSKPEPSPARSSASHPTTEAPASLNLQRLDAASLLQLQRTVGNAAVGRLSGRGPIVDQAQPIVQRDVMDYEQFAGAARKYLGVTAAEIDDIMTGRAGAGAMRQFRADHQIPGPGSYTEADLKGAFRAYEQDKNDLGHMIELYHAITFWQTLNVGQKWEVVLKGLLDRITHQLENDIQAKTYEVQGEKRKHRSRFDGLGSMFSKGKDKQAAQPKLIPVPDALSALGISQVWFSTAFAGHESLIPNLVDFYERLRDGDRYQAEKAYGPIKDLEGMSFIRSLILSHLPKQALLDEFMGVESEDEVAGGPLTAEEVQAIVGYSSGSHTLMNFRLRNADLRPANRLRMTRDNKLAHKMISDDMNKNRHLVTGLSKLPQFQGVAYRVVVQPSDMLWSTLQPGSVITDAGFVSASPSMTGVMNYDKGGKRNLYYIIHTHSAAHISGLSAKVDEAEILYRPGTQFRIQAVHQHIHGMVSVRAPIEAQMILHQFGEKSTDQAGVERPVKVVELVQV